MSQNKLLGISELTENAKTILHDRYLWKDKQTRELVEDIDGMFRRVAKCVADPDAKYSCESAEKLEEQFYDFLKSLAFVPNSPTLMNAGRKTKGLLSACFVIPVNDTIEDIYKAKTAAALIQSAGGGTGFCFSRLRAANAAVGSGAGTSSGPISFLVSFNSDTECIKQGGLRKGANMGTFSIEHPDIDSFITLKNEDHTSKQNTNNILKNFNISVLGHNRFFEAVKAKSVINIVDPVKGVIGTRDATELFDKITFNAWKNGDPGLLFIDKMNDDNPLPYIGEYDATNPCGEQPLLDWSACNLGHINLVHILDYNDGEYKINWNRYREYIRLAVDFLDNVIDANWYPLPEIQQAVLGDRRIGLGIMGWANLLNILEIPYDSEEAYELGREVMRFHYTQAVYRSIERSAERGAFNYWNDSIFDSTGKNFKLSPRFQQVLSESDFHRELFETCGIRNSTVVTVAPTGTCARIANCSFSLEPDFAPLFISKVVDKQLFDSSRLFQLLFDEYEVTEEEKQEIFNSGSIQFLTRIPQKTREAYKCTYDIKYDAHIRTQAVFQEWCDSAVSKTINMPEEATVEDVRNAYWMAYELGCKGITVYRNNCKTEQVLNIGSSEQDSKPTENKVTRTRNGGSALSGKTIKYKFDNKSVYITINEDEYGLREVFVNVGKSGSETSSSVEAISKLVSKLLENGIEVEEIIQTLEGIRGDFPTWNGRQLVTSYPDAIAKALKQYLDGLPTPELQVKQKSSDSNKFQSGERCVNC